MKKNLLTSLKNQDKDENWTTISVEDKRIPPGLLKQKKKRRRIIASVCVGVLAILAVISVVLLGRWDQANANEILFNHFSQSNQLVNI